MKAKDRIIVAIDSSNPTEIQKIVTELRPYVNCFKIGLEVLSAIGGPEVVNSIHSLGGRIFYDGKFSDIPNTTKKASEAIQHPNVVMFNVQYQLWYEIRKSSYKCR